MIRILQVVGKMHYGGMETLIMNIYRHIDRTKVQFDFLVHYREPGEYDSEIRALGGRIFVMPKTTPQNYLKCKKAYQEFFKEHHSYNKVHVHLHNMAFMIFPEAKKYNIDCVIHLHNKGVEKNIKGFLGVFCTKIAMSKADTIFACSQESAAFFIPPRCTKTYTIIKNGIIPERFLYNETVRNELRQKMQLDNKFVLLCAARFAVQKNHTFLLDIVNALIKYDKDIILLLAGEGPLEGDIKAKIKRLHLQENVVFLGARGDIGRIMQAADCYLMPSLWEGLPITYIEAQAAGLKIYTSEEAMSEEARITDLIEGISLSREPDYWAEVIYLQRAYERENQKQAILEHGFNIQETANYLQTFYEEHTPDDLYS